MRRRGGHGGGGLRMRVSLGLRACMSVGGMRAGEERDCCSVGVGGGMGGYVRSPSAGVASRGFSSVVVVVVLAVVVVVIVVRVIVVMVMVIRVDGLFGRGSGNKVCDVRVMMMVVVVYSCDSAVIIVVVVFASLS